jgi:GNAT superfamily N-acetyltransferase
MKIYTLADLPPDLRAEYAAVLWLDGDLPQDWTFPDRLTRLGFRFTDYQALVAVEDGHVQGRIETLVLEYRTPEGSEPVLGITGVLTRPDALRSGVASALLREAHARERTTGRRWSFLWTHRSWGAHRVYEQLGYYDVHSPPSAVRKVPRSTGPSAFPGYQSRPLRRREFHLLEELLRAGIRGRYGILPRFPGSFQARARLGWRSASNYIVLTLGAAPVGYAYTTHTDYAVSAVEVVVAHRQHAPAMLNALERKAAGRWLAFGRTTFVSDHEPLFRRHGYLLFPSAHATLMAKPLFPAARRPGSSDPRVVCRSARFCSHYGDVF